MLVITPSWWTIMPGGSLAASSIIDQPQRAGLAAYMAATLGLLANSEILGFALS